MKTSNKLLVGLFCVILTSMIVGNILIANEAKKHNYEINQENKIDNDSVNIKINF